MTARPSQRRVHTVAPIRRLSGYDVHCLRVETPSRPIHMGILAVVDGSSLLDDEGGLRVAEIRDQLEVRVAGLPELRRVVFRPGPLGGSPTWVDDPEFEIDQHVTAASVPAPGGERELLDLAERLLVPLLDRSRPLWRMFLVTGLAGGQVGVLVVVHHALADGQGAMRMVRALLEPPLEHAGPREPAAPDRSRERPPPWGALALDNLLTMAASAGILLRPATWRRAAAVARAAREVGTLSRNAPVSSLNAPVGARRRMTTVQLDLPMARRVSRAHDCGVNDVVLTLVAGGIRALLAARGERVELLRPRAGIAVALFSGDRGSRAGNDIGTLHVPLALADPDPGARLPAIAAARAEAGRSPFVAIEPVMRASFGRFGAFRRSLERQRLVNLSETYLPGPPSRIEILGAPVLELVPFAPLAGNLGLSFVALSYAGRVTIAVRADADRFPDLDVLAAAMREDWRLLSGRTPV